MSVTIPTKEYLDNLKPYQLEYLQAKEKFRVLMWHRGSHKTTDMLNNSLIEALKVKGLYWFISPYLNQGISTVWKDPNTSIFRWIPEGALKHLKVNNSDYSITFPNGSVWQLKGADKPDSLRGPKPIGITVDEYGEIAKRWGSELREAILEPTIRSSGGWIDYGGTPKGNNDFEFIRRLGQDPEAKEWWSSLKTVEDTGLYSQEDIENIKKNVTNLDFFYQEYYCRILEGASSVFKGHYECISGTLLEPEEGHSYVFGIDLARTFDRTVIVGFDTSTNHLVYFKSIERESWEQQRLVITAVLKRYNDAQAVVDATGVGDAFVEQLSASGVNVVPFKISSNQIKRTLVEKLAMFLENKYMTFPDIEAIKDELNSFEYEVTANNNVTYSAPIGKHDDIVMSMALATQLLNPIPTPIYKRTIVDDAIDQGILLDPRTGYWK